MAHIIYDNEQPPYYDSRGYNNPRYNGGGILLAVVILLILFFMANLPRLTGNPNATIFPVEDSITRNNTAIRYVTADNLNMREEPSTLARASLLLPRGTKVILLGNTHRDFEGDVWFRVRVLTLNGTRVGWVSKRYLA